MQLDVKTLLEKMEARLGLKEAELAQMQCMIEMQDKAIAALKEKYDVSDVERADLTNTAVPNGSADPRRVV